MSPYRLLIRGDRLKTDLRPLLISCDCSSHQSMRRAPTLSASVPLPEYAVDRDRAHPDNPGRRSACAPGKTGLAHRQNKAVLIMLAHDRTDCLMICPIRPFYAIIQAVDSGNPLVPCGYAGMIVDTRVPFL